MACRNQGRYRAVLDLSFLNKIVCLGKDVWLARVKFTVNSLDNVVPDRSRHFPFKRIDENIRPLCQALHFGSPWLAQLTMESIVGLPLSLLVEKHIASITTGFFLYFAMSYSSTVPRSVTGISFPHSPHTKNTPRSVCVAAMVPLHDGQGMVCCGCFWVTQAPSPQRTNRP